MLDQKSRGTHDVLYPLSEPCTVTFIHIKSLQHRSASGEVFFERYFLQRYFLAIGVRTQFPPTPLKFV
jgi:hypothetical protein